PSPSARLTRPGCAAVSFPPPATVSPRAEISNTLAPPTNPPLVSTTSSAPKSKVHVAPGHGGATATVPATMQATASQVVTHAPPQPAFTSPAVHTESAWEAHAQQQEHERNGGTFRSSRERERHDGFVRAEEIGLGGVILGGADCDPHASAADLC